MLEGWQTAFDASAILSNRFQHFSYNRFLDTSKMLNRLLPNLKRILHLGSKLLAHGALLGLLLIPNSMLAVGGRQSLESIGQEFIFSVAVFGLVWFIVTLRHRGPESTMLMLITCLAQFLIGGLLLARPYYEMTTTGWVLLWLAVVELLGIGWIRLRK